MPLTSNFANFFAGVQRDLDRHDKDKATFIRKVALKALEHLQTESPVLTGRYRAAHTLSIDSESEWEPPEATTEQGLDPNLIREADSQMEQAGIKLSRSKIKTGMTILIQNNVEYAPHVEARDSVYGRVEQRFDRFIRETLGGL